MQESLFNKTVGVFGSQIGFARALGVTPGLVAQWRRRGVPTERCLEIEAITREVAAERHDPTLIVTCEDLRPDLAWKVVRENPLPEREKPAA
jgi:DNA-binding transcriptional regulator YdaS (Cro superfamily)